MLITYERLLCVRHSARCWKIDTNLPESLPTRGFPCDKGVREYEMTTSQSAKHRHKGTHRGAVGHRRKTIKGNFLEMAVPELCSPGMIWWRKGSMAVWVEQEHVQGYRSVTAQGPWGDVKWFTKAWNLADRGTAREVSRDWEMRTLWDISEILGFILWATGLHWRV